MFEIENKVTYITMQSSFQLKKIICFWYKV